MLIWSIAAGLALMILERIIPDQRLPHVRGWWGRVILLNVFQLGIVVLGMATWDRWFLGAGLFKLEPLMPAPLSGLIAYVLITFVFYWWHRFRHESNFLWLAMHQVHHSPARIETVTSFFKHPLEIVCNSLIIGFLNHVVLGIGVAGSAYALLFCCLGEYFYHMNIATPRWLGWFFQRPEMHRIHHQRGRHFYNFSDLPLWDALFGTYRNPPSFSGPCGYKPEREARLPAMLAFQNVNGPMPRRPGAP